MMIIVLFLHVVNIMISLYGGKVVWYRVLVYSLLIFLYGDDDDNHKFYRVMTQVFCND